MSPSTRTVLSSFGLRRGAVPLLAGAAVAVLLAGCSSSTPATCTYNGQVHPVGNSVFPSSDGCNTCTCTVDGQVACTLIACFNQPQCSLDATYTYRDDGGAVAYADHMTLAPPSSYRIDRIPSSSSGNGVSCAPALPACQDATAIDAWDISGDVLLPDVASALAQAVPPFYGHDQRPVDGTVFLLARNAVPSSPAGTPCDPSDVGCRGFAVGSPCGAADTGCTPIPPGIQKLVDDLRALDQHQRQDPGCASLPQNP